MALEISAAEHACNVARRQILQEFPDVTALFIVYKDEQLVKMVNAKRREIVDHPAGGALMPLIEKAAKSPGAKNRFCGMATDKENKFIRFLGRNKTLACFFLCASDLIDAEDARLKVNALVWTLLKVIKNPQAPQTEAPDEIRAVWNNMLAYAFAALTAEMQGKKGYIRALARKLSGDALSSVIYKIDDYPYPIIVDATQLVYDDIRKIGFNKAQVLETAFDMTKEISETFDSSAALQWQNFSRAAQEMAWLEIDKNKILGAAALTSEDPYARSTAYLIGEMLHIDPTPLSDISVYNAFTDPEINERHHRKLCEEAFENIATRLSLQENADLLRQEIAKRNLRLCEGEIIGWCSPALLAAAQAYDFSAKEGPQAIENARGVFQDISRAMTGETLRKLAQIIIALRRDNQTVTPEAIATMAKEDESLRAVTEALTVIGQ